MKRVIVAAAAVFAAVGCGPSTTQLVAHKHHREALCAQSNEEEVARALFQDTNAFIHLHVVTDDELARAVGPAAPAVAARARFVRLELETNRIPVDGMRVAIRAEPAVVTRPSYPRLAQITGEALPAAEARSTVLTPNNVLQAGAILFSGGLWLLTNPSFDRGTTYVDAPPEKYRAMAPIAFALHEATGETDDRCAASLSSAREEAPVGLHCATYLVVDRPVSRPIDLVLTFGWVAYRWRPEQRDTQPEERDTCIVEHTVRIPAALDIPFGTKPRPVGDLAASR